MPDWHSFDPHWFRRRWPSLQLPEGDLALRQWYLRNARHLAPNPLFEPVAAGNGVQRRWHWLFEPAVYLDQLQARGIAGPDDPYSHFLTFGDRNGLRPGWFFLPKTYLEGLSPDEAATARGMGAFRHFLRHRQPGCVEPRLSPFFDPGWYAAQHPEAVAGVRDGTLPSVLVHYLLHCRDDLVDPLPQFSEREYRQLNPDVAAAIQKGQLFSGYEHFLNHGQHEGRSFGRGPSPQQYLAMNRSARAEIEAGGLPGVFAHMVLHGPAPERIVPDEDKARALFRMQAEIGLFRLRQGKLDFTLTGPARVSVLMVLHNQIALTMQALETLQGQLAGELELVLIDSGSQDDTRGIGQMVRGARILRHEENIQFVAGCNEGLALATAPAVLLLNNDTRLAPDAVERGLRRLRSDPQIGAVGGMVLRSHGVLQEAGCILRSDAMTVGYMRGARPEAPEARFLREVDFCSGVFLMLDTALMRGLGGLDPAFSPAYYEETDLCLRIRQAGRRIIYDPKIRIEHLEYGSSGHAAANAHMRRSRKVFQRKHAAALALQPAPGVSAHLARSPGAGRRVLVIEDRIPLRQTGSGYVRSNDIIRVLADLGHQVTVLGLEAPSGLPEDIEADFPETVEILHDLRAADLPGLLADRAGGFDTVWLCRTHNLDRIAEQIVGVAPRLILDTEAIATQRNLQRAQLDGVPFDAGAGLALELKNIGLASRVLAVSRAEAALLRDQGHPQVGVLGHMVAPRKAPGPGRREGLLFLGALHDTGAPNYNSLLWFVGEVLDRVVADLGPQIRLTIAGHVAGGIDMSPFEGHPNIDLLGPVDDLAPLFDAHRVFVAPTRIAAGIPHKLHEAAAHGLPAVATDLLCRQLEWDDGREILSAPVGDAGVFARQVRRLYTDPNLWNGVQRRVQRRLRAENTPEAFRAAIAGFLDQG